MSSIDPFEAGELLASLVDKSLVVFDEAQNRYRLMETVRQYARDRLHEAGDEPLWRNRHLGYFLDMAEEARPHLRGPEQLKWLAQLETDHDNLRAALDWSEANRENAASGLALAAALWRFWLLRCHLFEGRDRLSRAIERAPDRQSEVLARALNGAAILAEVQCDFPTARALHDEGLAISRGRGDHWFTAMSLNNIGNVFGSQGEFESALPFWEEALEIWRDLESRKELGDKRGIAATLDNLGNVAHWRGDLAGAQALYEECLAIRRELGNLSGVAYSQINLANLNYVLGDFEAARARYRECLLSFREFGDPFGIAASLEGIALLETPLRAARLWGAAELMRERLGAPITSGEMIEYERRVSASRAALDDDAAFDAAWKEGRALTLDQAVELASVPSA